MTDRLMFARVFCVFGFLAVACGAFGAHALKTAVTPERLDVWHTATLYLFVHALAGLLALQLCKSLLSCVFFAVGCLLFSGSLYALVWFDVPLLGAITPLGGVTFLLGWVSFAFQISPDSRGGKP